jgi:ATP-dependent Clp protease protease subunit
VTALDAQMRTNSAMSLGDSVYDRLLRERIVFLGQQVDDQIANQICAQLLLLSAEEPGRDISLYINSPGGSITAGMAIYDTMEFIECDVATYAMGLTKKEMAEIIAGHTGRTPEQIAADSDRDRWFTAKEALDYGFVDHIVARASELPGGVAPPAE